MERKQLILLFVILLIVVPIMTLLLTNWNLFNIDVNNNWIGFYGSYIGSIVGVYGVFKVMQIDQAKRNEERNDEMFFKNINIYKGIIRALRVEKLSDFEKNLSRLKDKDAWNMVDSDTKRKLDQILSNMEYTNETNGLFNSIKDYIVSSLYNELKVTIKYPGDEFTEYTEYEDLPDEGILDEITRFVINNSYVDLLFENYIEIHISKTNLSKFFNSEEFLMGYDSKVDAVYSKLLLINDSKEWLGYLSKREETFNELRRLKKRINDRIEKVLTY